MSDNQLTEEWQPVKEFEGWYSVSSLGRVRRDAPTGNQSPAGTILKPGKEKWGYSIVGLWKNGRKKTVKVARLVADAFLEIRPAGSVINHDDGDKSNNAASNLEYTTQKKNIHHAIDKLGHRYGCPGERHPFTTLTNQEVAKIRERHAKGGITQATIAKEHGVKPWVISDIIRRKKWRHI